MKNATLRLVPDTGSSLTKSSGDSQGRKKNKMLLGTYGYKYHDEQGRAKFKLVSIPDEIY